MLHAMDYLASKGIGMVHTVSGIGFAGELDITLEKIVDRGAQHGFQMRVFPQSLDATVATSRKLPRIGGCFACALDGCFGSADAALTEPYAASGDCGVLYYTDEQIIDFCKQADDLGLQIEMHAIGDAAFAQATRCLKAALDATARADHRHGIIHGCLPTPEGIEICAEYGIQMPMQTSFIDWPQEPDSYLESLLGPARAARLNPIRTLWDKGIVISAGSDAPCTDPDPIMWMDKAVNNPNEDERLTRREALRMCTYNGAWTDEIINRAAEAHALHIARELGLDETFVYEDPDEGWKLSRFIDGCEPFDYGKRDHVQRALSLARRLHESGEISPWSFDYRAEAEKIAGILRAMHYPLPRDFSELAKRMGRLADHLAADGGEPVLCHNDFYGPNLLVHGDDMWLIDWEYSAMGDYACDLGNFVAQGSNYPPDETLEVIDLYYGRKATAAEQRHCLAAVALVGWYWYVWAIYKGAKGSPVGEWLYVWYRAAQTYCDAAMPLYEEDMHG